jgi:hypothetical protein
MNKADLARFLHGNVLKFLECRLLLSPSEITTEAAGGECNLQAWGRDVNPWDDGSSIAVIDRVHILLLCCKDDMNWMHKNNDLQMFIG